MEHWVRARFTPNLPLGRDGKRVTASAEHIAISKNAAKEGMVLLKNTGGLLPLKRGAKVALFGKGTADYVKGGGGSGDVYCPYVHNILDGFRSLSDEVSVFPESAEFYEKYVASCYAEGGIPGLIREPEVPSALLQRAAAWADVAVISISRYSGEGWDRKSDYGGPASEPPDGFTHIHLADTIFEHSDFYLTEAEQKMVHDVSAHFSKVIVLLNIGGMADTRWIRDDDGITAAMITWQGGMEGGLAAAELIMGHGTPSGKLADTFAGTLEDYPSTKGFHESDDFVDYTEDIYVGYRYFETIPGASSRVVYPFGYGLSYTTFELRDIRAEQITDRAGDEIRVRLSVVNTGSFSGREVVQLYYSAPQGKLGKPSRELADWQKTRLLLPGEIQEITLKVPVREMASYDDLGKIRKSAWILEKGTYRFYAGTSVRDTAEPAREDGNGTFVLEIPSDQVVQQCEARLVPAKLKKRMLSDGSYEDLPTHEQTDIDDNIFTPLKFPDEIECVAPEVRHEDSYQTFLAPSVPQLSEVAEGSMSLDDFIRSLTDEDLTWLLSGTPNTGCANTFGWGNLRASGVPNVMTADGPAGVRFNPETGVRTTAFPCATLLACTWDPEAVRAVGEAGGREARENNIGIWLTPAVNIHRSPLCGRNFEYYSEDPLLAGRQASAMTEGIQSCHVAACVKHFALNDKETNRKESDSRVSERAAREIYLKQFEIIVKTAHPWSLMSSYNRVNGYRASENHDLLTGILRDEWGYDGVVTTDWWGCGEQYRECRAGNDVKMGCGFPARLMEAYRKGAVSRSGMETAARHILTAILRLDAD